MGYRGGALAVRWWCAGAMRGEKKRRDLGRRVSLGKREEKRRANSRMLFKFKFLLRIRLRIRDNMRFKTDIHFWAFFYLYFFYTPFPFGFLYHFFYFLFLFPSLCYSFGIFFNNACTYMQWQI
jgi:hypothetical protein